MNGYNPFPESDESYVPEGISGIDFPISLYERPTLALSNLLMRGDIDAATRAMLSPQTLTPTELQTFRSRLLKGKKANPILKTILDVTTNPLFVIGLALAYVYPIAGVKPLHALFTGASGEVAKVGPWASQMHSAFTNLRNVPGFIRALADYTKETTKFTSIFGPKMQKIFAGLSSTDADQIGAFMMAEKWGSKGTWLQKIIPAKYGIAYKDIGPLAPGLGGKVSPGSAELAKRMRVWFDEISDRFPADWDKSKWMTMWSELQLKGVQLRGAFLRERTPGPKRLRDYVAHIIAPYDKYTAAGANKTLSSLTVAERAEWTDKMIKYNISPNLLNRGLRSIPDLNQLKMAHEQGWLHPKVWPAMNQWITDLQGQFTKDLGGIWAQHGGNFSKGIPKGFLESLFEKLKEAPWQMELGGKLKERTTIYNTLTHIGNRLVGAKTPQALQQEITSVGGLFATPAQYTMRATEILPKYLKSMAPTFAWHVKGYGPQITKFANQTTGWQATYTKDQLVPLLRGFKTWKGTLRATAFGEQKQRIYSWVRDHKLFDPPFPQSTRKWMTDYFSNVRGGGGVESLSSDIAHYFYLSTLGFPNLSPTLKNTGQTWITTANVVGGRGMKEGMQLLIPRWGKYISLRGKGIAQEIAWKRAFPEFAKEAGMAKNFLDEMVTEGVMRGAGGSKAIAIVDKMKKGMMMPFQTSEVFLNRLLSFYSAYGSGLADGMTKKAAAEVGRVMVDATQFPGGPLNMPRLIMDMSPAFRQFMHFPLRYLGFLSSSVRWGAKPGTRQWGTIGRAMMGSTAAYHGAKNVLGMDISQGLLWGALPGPVYEGSPFFPAPFVPPIIGIGGALAASTATGDPKYLQSVLPLLVPGGLGIRRIYRSTAPRYADYQSRTEDGRIPIYNRGRSLIGTYSPFELFLRSVGVNPSSQAAEQGAAQWLLKQRDKMRWYRAEYVNALSQNNLKKAEELNREFQEAYPELGPMAIKKSDITALQNRKEISRLGRILKGFPKEVRPLFERAASEAMLGNMMQDVENTPQNLGYYSNMFGTPQVEY